MIDFEKQIWYDKGDIENAAKRIPISAFHLNRIENAIQEVVNHENSTINHWWKRSKIVDVITEITTKISSGDHGISSGRVNCFTSSTSTTKIYYSDSVNVKKDSSTGTQYIELNKPTAWDVTHSSYGTEANYTLQNKYIILILNSNNYESKTPPFHTFTTNTKNGGVLFYNTGSSASTSWTAYMADGGSRTVYGIKLQDLYETQTRNVYGETEYVNSPNQGAYPDGWNEIDSLMYEYLGVPFENSIESLGVECGYFYGDGQNSRLIKTRKTPAFVWFNPGASSYAVTSEAFSAGSYGNYIRITNGGFITENSPSATNSIGTKYNYVVFY